MSFPRYPKYKDSGVEWLGEVPGYWEVLRIKHLVASLEQGWSPQCEGFPVQSEDEWGVLKVGCVNGGVFRPEENKTLPPELEPLPELGLASGDLLISRANTRELVGSAAVALRDYPRLMLCDKLFRLRLQAEACAPVFLALYLGIPRVRGQIELSATGASSSMLNIGQSTILELDVAVPPSDEQTAIAAFLGRETTKIDALVAEQENLIGLLKEKRQAVISHAVTKGLDPSVPMKDSGVEWLGEVPQHWEISSLKRYWTVTDCKHVTAEFVDEGFPLASIREVQSRWVELDEAKQTTEYFYQLLIEGNRDPQPGDLIFSRNATVGEVAQVHASHPKFSMGQDVVLLRRIEQAFSPDFLQFVLRSTVVVQQLALCMIGSTFKRINVEEIRSFVIAFPPPSEQVQIATHLLAQAGNFDQLIDEALQSIELLRERRTALISAAVTGQIDVRGLSHVEVA